MNDPYKESPQAQSARSSLHDLKNRLKQAEPVHVDQTGRLSTPQEEAFKEKMGTATPRTTVKPSRWF